MAVKRVKTTKLDIIKCASKLFFEQGYSATSPRQICDILDLSTGNITYYFPTKEHLLAVFVEMLCQYQWAMVMEEAPEGIDTVTAVCLELAAMTALCDDNEVARDFYLSAYTSPRCLELIRRSDAYRAREVFGSRCPDWTQEQFAQAETLVSGVEYATLCKTGDCAPQKERIAGGLRTILWIYGFNGEEREARIQQILAMDYQSLSGRMLVEFRAFIDRANDRELERLIKAKQAQLAKKR